MKITNEQIIVYYTQLTEAFSNSEQYLPVRIGFAINKNMQNLQSMVAEIDAARMRTARQYGKLIDNNQYSIPPESAEMVNQELNDLAEIEQEIDIQTVSLSAIEDLEFTIPQIKALNFMIKE